MTRTISFFSAGALLFAAGAACAQGARIVPQASGVDVRLRGISAVSDKVAWASGREGTVLRTTDGGEHWQAVPVPGAGALDFRDIEGFDAQNAIVLSIGPGEVSRVYRTEDGGAHWRLVLQNAAPKAFFDCIAFDGNRGWLLGDPVDGRFQIYRSDDAGRSWAPVDTGMPAAKPDEAAFAAGGTCIAPTPAGGVAVVGGGAAARVFLGDADATHWSVHDTTMPARVPAAGIFSAAPMGAGMLLVGGDFEHEGDAGSAARLRLADDAAVAVVPLVSPRGYRSGAACAAGTSPACIAVGPGGVDLLVDGHWQALSDTGYDAIDLAGDVGWASGDGGRIARIVIDTDQVQHGQQ